MASWAPDSPGEAFPGGVGYPKPTKRYVASQTEWGRIREHFRIGAGCCCAHCGHRAESLHHAVPKSQGGGDLIPNLVPLCGDGARGCHGLLETHGTGWERVANSVRQYICSSPQRWAYVLGQLGAARFDRRYPGLNQPCPHHDCLLPAGHQGVHLDLGAPEFQPREWDWEPPPFLEND